MNFMRKGAFTSKKEGGNWLGQGGMLTALALAIALLPGLLALFIYFSLPLFYSSQIVEIQKYQLPSSLDANQVLALGQFPSTSSVYVIDREGYLHIFSPQKERSKIPLPGRRDGQFLEKVHSRGKDSYLLVWKRGEIDHLRLDFSPLREIPSLEFRDIQWPDLQENTFSFPFWSKYQGRETFVALNSEGQIEVWQRVGGEKESHFVLADSAPGEIRTLALDSKGLTLYGGTSQGCLLSWDLSQKGRPRLLDLVPLFHDQAPLTSLELFPDDQRVMAGDQAGRVTLWYLSDREEGGRKLGHLASFPSQKKSIDTLIPPSWGKSFLMAWGKKDLAIGQAHTGEIALFLTEKREILQVSYSRSWPGVALLTSQGDIRLYHFENFHPEVTTALVGQQIWPPAQRRGRYGNKMALYDLLKSLLVGVGVAFLFLLPFVFFAAVYTSQFASKGLRRWTLNITQVLAETPTIIIGFIAACGLAPWLAKTPLFFPLRQGGYTSGEITGGILSFTLILAMAPYIFIAMEEAFSSVPQRLTRASFTLGATPGQTLKKIILPMAWPGVVASLCLAVTRALAEGALVLLVLGAWALFPAGLGNPFSLEEAGLGRGPAETSWRLLFFCGVALVFFTLVFNSLSVGLRRLMQIRYKKWE